MTIYQTLDMTKVTSFFLSLLNQSISVYFLVANFTDFLRQILSLFWRIPFSKERRILAKLAEHLPLD